MQVSTTFLSIAVSLLAFGASSKMDGNYRAQPKAMDGLHNLKVVEHDAGRLYP
jgi:hypothetical protein